MNHQENETFNRRFNIATNVRHTENDTHNNRSGLEVGYWIKSVLYVGLFLMAVTGLLGWLLWISGIIGMLICISVIVIASASILWWLAMNGATQYWKMKAARFASHFYSHPSMVIGDYYTSQCTPFYIPLFPEKELPAPKNDYQEAIDRGGVVLLTNEQQREKSICDLREEGKTYKEIVEYMKHNPFYESITLHEVRKVLGKTGKE